MRAVFCHLGEAGGLIPLAAASGQDSLGVTQRPVVRGDDREPGVAGFGYRGFGLAVSGRGQRRRPDPAEERGLGVWCGTQDGGGTAECGHRGGPVVLQERQHRPGTAPGEILQLAVVRRRSRTLG